MITTRHEHRTLAPSGARLVALLAAVAALAVSGYLSVEHYDHGTSFACPHTATINCLKVTTSSWSVIAGIPVAVLGLAYFAVMTILIAIPVVDRRLQLLRLGSAAVGVLMALYLVYIELFQVDAICLWCTAVHVLTLVMFGAVLWMDALAPRA